jgi:hypothetical protein
MASSRFQFSIRWYQFRLRALLMLLTLVGLAFAWWRLILSWVPFPSDDEMAFERAAIFVASLVVVGWLSKLTDE